MREEKRRRSARGLKIKKSSKSTEQAGSWGRKNGQRLKVSEAEDRADCIGK